MKDRMSKYESKLSEIVNPIGFGIMITGCIVKSTPMGLLGATTVFSGYAIQTIKYLKGYFNERLELQERQKESELKGKV